MAIPDYQTVMLPLLRLAARQGETSTSEATAARNVYLGRTVVQMSTNVSKEANYVLPQMWGDAGGT